MWGQRTEMGEEGPDNEVEPLGEEAEMEEGYGWAGDEALKAGDEYV